MEPSGISIVKLEVFIPCSHLEMLRKTLQSVGAGAMGNYDSAMNYSKVKGCWRPLPGENPYDGEIGVLTETEEYKVEVCVKYENLDKTVNAVREAHPYEMPVINIIPLHAIN
jgi:hypothetical protein